MSALLVARTAHGEVAMLHDAVARALHGKLEMKKAKEQTKMSESLPFLVQSRL